MTLFWTRNTHVPPYMTLFWTRNTHVPPYATFSGQETHMYRRTRRFLGFPHSGSACRSTHTSPYNRPRIAHPRYHPPLTPPPPLGRMAPESAPRPTPNAPASHRGLHDHPR